MPNAILNIEDYNEKFDRTDIGGGLSVLVIPVSCHIRKHLFILHSPRL